MYRQQTKKIKKSITPQNTYILSQHILQIMVQSTVTVFVLFFFSIWQMSTYVFFFLFITIFCKQHLVQTSTVNHNPSKRVCISIQYK